MSMIAPSLRKSPASSRGASIFLLFLVCSVLGVAAPALVASENGSVVEPPLGPLIYENAENQKLSLIWFHSSLNRRALGNITTFQPLRYVAPRMSDDRAVVASVFEQGTPVAVHRISTLLSPVDVFPDLPGDQFNALDALIGMSRDDMLLGAHSHSIARLDSGNSNPRIDIFPGQIIEGGDSLFVGLRWAAGFPVSPQVGAQEGLGAIASQYIGYERPPDAIWVRSPDNYSLEVELLDWRPGPTINARGVTAFETWYAADSLSGPSEAIMSALITSDTLLWETPVIQDGYLSVAAVNPGGERSEPIRASIRVSEFS
ncbi:MAG: hypothetical protein ACE5GA_06590, partial [Candidatus Zixiibacteriota bacterium]